ncbi:hypothetical protein A2U01_0029094, partial [Trifolium medium]|nr:hypothetical protein [Trifolium medium]
IVSRNPPPPKRHLRLTSHHDVALIRGGVTNPIGFATPSFYPDESRTIRIVFQPPPHVAISLLCGGQDIGSCLWLFLG